MESHKPDAPLPLMDCAKVDLSLLSSSSAEELGKLHHALSSWGCLQLVNHGMTTSFLNEVRQVIKQFYALPIVEKEKYIENKGPGWYGTDNAIEQQYGSWNETFHLHLHPEEQIKFEDWPQKPENFRATLHEYSIKARMILETLLKAMARSLKLDEDRFLSGLWRSEEDTLHVRFNFYPRTPSSNLILGLKPHGDGTAITILLQDTEVEGLQILKDNEWFRVPTFPEALTIIVGDQMEITSNGIFKSPTHQVTANPECERISAAMLSIPNKEKEIGPLPELINEERPQLYKRFKDYGLIFNQYNPSGDRPINAVKLNNL